MQLSGSVVYYLVALIFVIEGMCVKTLTSGSNVIEGRCVKTVTSGSNTNVYIEFSAHDDVK